MGIESGAADATPRLGLKGRLMNPRPGRPGPATAFKLEPVTATVTPGERGRRGARHGATATGSLWAGLLTVAGH